jgi:Peptidase A4 family
MRIEPGEVLPLPWRHGRQPERLCRDALDRRHHRRDVDLRRAESGCRSAPVRRHLGGIGSYSTSDLIQAGVSENSAPNNGATGNQYAAWYELLPAAETNLKNCKGAKSCPVQPGDDVTVTIQQTSVKRWNIAVADSTEK